MNKTTKLNGPIRALFKSKAKEKLEGRGSIRARELNKERTKVLEQFESLAEVKPLLAGYRDALQKRDEAQKVANEWCAKLKAIAGVEYGNHGGFSYLCSKAGTNLKATELAKQYDSIGDEIKRARDCRCQVGDSPELLEFLAQLSLCKTIGDADKLLEKLAT
jgi:hypothetical protein